MPNTYTHRPNKGKNLNVEFDGKKYSRFPIRTHVITKNDNIIDICTKYAAPHIQNSDWLFISERIVAICQGRAFPIKDIRPSFLAKVLSKFVHKSPYGIGLGSPWTMELAIREAGLPKIAVGAFIAALARFFGKRGIFYRFVGKNINAIDGPCDYTLPPYNKYAKLGPVNPEKVACELKSAINCKVIIIDANDLGVTVLGKSENNISDSFCKNIFKDNPLGQGSEQTPLCIVRKSF